MVSNGGRTDPSGFEKLQGLYQIAIEQEGAILEFLSEQGWLYPMLFEAPERISQIFGADAKTALELERAPDEGWEELFVVVKTNLPAEEGVRRTRQIIDDWFAEQVAGRKCLINLVEEPI